MGKFEERLGDSISEAEGRKQVSDELYAKYKQFVGALDALPQDAIAIDRLSTDIHDQFGRVKPFSQWPTKSSRARSEKIWLNYNQRMQLQQAAKEGELSQEDPTADPDFLGQMLDTCVRTSMQMGRLDKQTAFRHCSRQVKRFEDAVRGAMADRGLTSKQVEEFTKNLLRGMANGKNVDIKDLSIEDQQFIQDLKDSLTYKPKSEGVVREDLEDKDEFSNPCDWGCGNRTDNFHDAHTVAVRALLQQGNKWFKTHTWQERQQPGNHEADLKNQWDTYKNAMARFGFKPIEEPTSSTPIDSWWLGARNWTKEGVAEAYERVPMWMPEKEWNDFTSQIFDLTGQRRPGEVEVIAKPDAQEVLKNIARHDKTVRRVIAPDLKEDLEDKDEFVNCQYCESIFTYSPELTPEDQDAFHIAHRAALERGDWTDKRNSFADAMAKYGFVHAGQGEHGSAYHWIRKPLKEDLEDQDVFRDPCDYYDCDNRPDAEQFHKAHTTAHDQARKGPAIGKFSDALAREMAKFGYHLVDTGRPVTGGTPFDSRDWTLRESLEDVDEFEHCEYGDCLQRNDPKFHDAHTEAAIAGDAAYLRRKAWSDFLEAFGTIMTKYGYTKDAAGSWQKTALREDEARPTPTLILPNMKTLGVGDWIEIGPQTKAPTPGAGLDDTDEFSGSEDDFPITPVEIVDIIEITKKYHPPHDEPTFRVRVSNARLLTLPDKSGVRWHGRPKHYEPSWYEPWYWTYYSYDLYNLFEKGQLRPIDNIEQWYQAQPEK